MLSISDRIALWAVIGKALPSFKILKCDPDVGSLTVAPKARTALAMSPNRAGIAGLTGVLCYESGRDLFPLATLRRRQ